MKQLPEKIPMKATLFGSLEKGGHLQTYGNEDLGVYRSAIKETRNHDWVESWTCDGVEGVFDSYGELRAAYAEAQK